VVLPCPTHEDPLPIYLAQTYSALHPAMHLNSVEGFVNGTTNGARWYPVIGSLQDWLWHNTGGVDITLELHEDKKPPAGTLEKMWEENKQPLMRFMEMVRVV
jgi:Zinc carboxypeptidase